MSIALATNKHWNCDKLWTTIELTIRLGFPHVFSNLPTSKISALKCARFWHYYCGDANTFKAKIWSICVTRKIPAFRMPII